MRFMGAFCHPERERGAWRHGRRATHATRPLADARGDSGLMRTSTSIKLAIAAVVALFFAGFVLRAATRLASAAMHSMLMLVVVVVVILWAVWKFR